MVILVSLRLSNNSPFFSPNRVNIIEIQIPDDEKKQLAVLELVYKILKLKFAENPETKNEHIEPFDKTRHVKLGGRFTELLGEFGATTYLTRRYQPHLLSNWALHNEDIMDAFYEKKSIQLPTTMMSTKCNNEWVKENEDSQKKLVVLREK